MMYLKVHKNPGNDVVAICDIDIIGKELENKELYLKVTENFYKGKKVTKEEVNDILKKKNNFNLVGEESVTCAIELDLIESNNILWLGKVPHAIIFKNE